MAQALEYFVFSALLEHAAILGITDGAYINAKSTKDGTESGQQQEKKAVDQIEETLGTLSRLAGLRKGCGIVSTSASFYGKDWRTPRPTTLKRAAENNVAPMLHNDVHQLVAAMRDHDKNSAEKPISQFTNQLPMRKARGQRRGQLGVFRSTAKYGCGDCNRVIRFKM